jgi:ribosomal RNA assembly protein
MTEQIYSENTRKIRANKRLIENSFKIKISIKDKIVNLEGKPENEFLALQFIEAVNLGFSVNQAMNLLEEDFVFLKIQIKAITKRENLAQIKARVIGKRRKAMNTIESLTDCDIALHDSTVGIIGYIQDAKNAEFAIKNIIAGSKHSAMYGYLEKKRAEEKSSL